MNSIKSIVATFSIFTAIPMPRVDMKRDNLKYVFCWLPLVGVVMGAVECVWHYAALKLGLGAFIYGALAALIPFIITGGMHIYGYMNMCGSSGRTGGIACTAAYFIVFFALLASLYGKSAMVLGFATSFVAVRAMAVILTITAGTAHEDGVLHSLLEARRRFLTEVITVVWLMGSLSAMECCNGLAGAAIILIIVVIFELCRKQALKKQGGVSENVVDFFICAGELTAALGFALAGFLL